MKTFICNGKLICGDNIIPHGHIGIENGIITEIGTDKDITAKGINSNVYLIDAEGSYISPGFIDLHVHGVGICDLSKDPDKALRKMAKILASQGTTSFLPTIITAPLDEIIEMMKKIHSNSKLIQGANVLGINLEGPFINPEKRGAHPVNDIINPDIGNLKKIIDAGSGFLKIMTVAPEMPGALDLAAILKQNSVIPAMGHTMASYEETVNAIGKGFHYITHIFNAMAPMHQRAPGPIPAVLMSRDVTIEIIADGVHLAPAIIKLLCQIKEREKLVLITDALAGIMRKGDKAEFAGETVESNGSCAYNSSHKIMGSVTPMNKAIQNIIQFTDLSLTQAIKLATINPANVLGVSKQKGTIEVGKDADIVILGDDLSVKTTIVGGRVI